jgi:amino acid adenylation domain-containing protein
MRNATQTASELASGAKPTNGKLQGQHTYWKNHLANLPAALELPTDRPRTACQRFHGAGHSFSLSVPLTEALRELSRREDVTLAMTLLAAFQTLLQRYSGQEDIVVGSPIAKRSPPEFESETGAFANLLVLRTDMSGDPSFQELLSQVREVYLGAEAHPEVSYEKLIEELQLQRDLDRHPLLQVLFRLQQASQEALVPPVEDNPTPCELALELVETPEGLAGRFYYNRDLFEAATIARMARHFQTLLENSVADPSRRLSALFLMTDLERRQLMIDWNQTRVDFPPAVCVHQMVEAQVERTPEAVAVVFDGQELTYAELNRRANQLARHLQTLGVGPDVLVAIRAERSLEIIVGLLGILKAGGAYLPLDPEIPPERLRFILKDGGGPVILTQQRLVASMPEVRARVVCLDSHWPQIARHSAEPVASPVTPDNLAYVIYTSGSTGRPKGVMIPHRGIVNTLRWRLREFPMGPDDRVMHNISFDFDASVCATFAPLAGGSRLYLLPPGAHRDPRQIVEAVMRHQITHMLQATALLRVFVEERCVNRCTSLQRLFCGGEALTLDIQQQCLERLNVDLVNLYGPTEISVDATFWVCQRESGYPVIPIGRPPANVQVYVLDAHRRPTPIGVPGELYVGGAGLAWGYLNNPALTAEKFIPNPFSAEPGRRLYRTGDLCRWLPDGNLDFLGRVDHQVKIRGVRIEPGEIEGILAKYSAVREGLVLAREYAPGDKRLVAYVAPHQPGGVTEGELRRYLKDSLPEYMVPSAFVLLESLPRAPNGKLDMKALPAPDHGRTDSERTHVAPRTPLEEYLAQTWREILGVGPLGRTDNFFERGGNSIQAAILIHRLQEKLAAFVYTVAIYDAPTIAALARYLSENYPEAVTRLFGPESLVAVHSDWSMIDADKVAMLDRIIRRLPPRPQKEPGPRNPHAIFILSPPRSGSTLSRVMLGGHPRLFAPPELQLGNFNTLAERKAVLSTERDRFWLDGTIRALMEIKKCDSDEATRVMEDCEKRGLTVKEFYRLMQDWLGEQVFVEKTPTYALDIGMLRRAEEDFEAVKYIHLIRHPNAVIRSFEEARLQVFFPPFFTDEHPFSARHLAELVWYINHRNIREFLKDIPAERQHRVYFEELVSQPPKVMKEVAQFLNLDFDENMVDPYREEHKSRMTDAIHPMARMLGDVKFHQHKGIDARAAEHANVQSKLPLGELTRRLARELGYDMDEEDRRAAAWRAVPPIPHRPAGKDHRLTLVPIQPHGSLRPFFCIHPAGGTVFCYRELSDLLGAEQPFYGLQSRGLNGEQSPHTRLEDMASDYLDALRTVQPEGPYCFGGWSIGGVVAFEMARQLQAQGQGVDLIALFDSDFPEKNPPALDPAKFMIEFALHGGLDVSLDQLVQMTADEQLTFVLGEAQKAKLFPAELSVADFRRIFQNYSEVFQANIRATRAYVPAPSSHRLVQFRAAHKSVSVAYEPRWLWEQLVPKVDLHQVPGDHYTILREPNVQTLARKLAGYLRQAQGLNGAASHP